MSTAAQTSPATCSQPHSNHALGPSTWRLARSIAHKHRRSFAASADLTGEAMLAAIECARRFDAARGSAPNTYAFARMQGRTLDALRREARHHRTCLAVHAEQTAAPGEGQRVAVTARIDVGRAVEAVQEELRSSEKLVLRGIYRDDATMRELAQRGPYSESQLHRAHASLLQRLRGQLMESGVSARG